MTKQQIQRIYAMGAVLGILESGNKRDNLHLLVESITGKDSISSLTQEEIQGSCTRACRTHTYTKSWRTSCKDKMHSKI